MGRKNKIKPNLIGRKDGRCDVCGKFLYGYKNRCKSCSRLVKTVSKGSKLHYDGEKEIDKL